MKAAQPRPSSRSILGWKPSFDLNNSGPSKRSPPPRHQGDGGGRVQPGPTSPQRLGDISQLPPAARRLTFSPPPQTFLLLLPTSPPRRKKRSISSETPSPSDAWLPGRRTGCKVFSFWGQAAGPWTSGRRGGATPTASTSRGRRTGGCTLARTPSSTGSADPSAPRRAASSSSALKVGETLPPLPPPPSTSPSHRRPSACTFLRAPNGYFFSRNLNVAKPNSPPQLPVEVRGDGTGLAEELSP